MTTLLLLVPAVPLAVAGMVAVIGWRSSTAWASTLAGLAVAASGAVLAVDVLEGGPVTALGGTLRVDSVSCLMLLLIGTVATITTAYGATFLTTELRRGETTPRRARLYGTLVQVTVAAMTVVVIVDNLGVMWVAVETTTIATVLLVGHRRDRAAVEASWKYLVLGSVGVATALLGTVLVYFVSVHGAVDADEALHWSVLVRAADGLEPAPLRLAIGLVVVGYGTKAGLAPLHSWLPDAYSQAPAPVAGLMSGAVSAMSMYALFRFKVIADLVIGDAFVRRLLIVAALSSLVVAASLMVTQRDFKRLLAYSSVEHVGLVALAAAVGSPLAMSAALLHLVGNGLVKAVTFSVTGEITFLTGTSRISDARGLLRRQPVAGTLFALGIVALAGLPPFSILASEVALVRAGVDDGLTWVIAVALAVMLVIFTALVVHTLDLLTGPGDLLTGPGDRSTEPILDAEPGHVTTLAARAPLAAGLALAAVIGVTIWPISRLLHSAAEVLAK